MEKNSSTETAFLDAAERLFADYGFDGTRVRAIAEASKTNLGALHYYWGSKEALFAAVWKCRMEPLVEKRRQQLEDLLASPEGASIDPERFVAMWIEAGLGLGLGVEPNETFQRLYGRALTDPSPAVQQVVSQYFDETGHLLVRLIRRACPELDDTAVYWRMQCLLGAVLYAHIGRARLDRVTQELDADRTLAVGARHLVQAITAGFRASTLTPAS